MTKNFKKIFLLFCLFLTMFSFMNCGYYSIGLNKHRRIDQTRINFLENLKNEKSESLSHILHGSESIKKISSKLSEMFQISSVPITNYFNIQYYGDIYIGSNYQEMSVIFDTGSNILWVSSKDCSQCRNFTAKYSPEESTTFKDLKTKKNITYAIGFVDGSYVQDDVYIGQRIIQGTRPSYLMAAKEFKFLVVNYESQLEGTIADGVLGLGFEFEGDTRNSFIYTLYEQGQIKKPQFSFYLTDSKIDSRLYIGDISENTALESIFSQMSSCDVKEKSHYWQCGIQSISISNDAKKPTPESENQDYHNSTYSLPSNFQSSSQVIFDTGTSYVIIPAFDFINILPHFIDRALENICGVTPYFQFICKCKSPQDFDNIILNFSDNNKFVIFTENLVEYYPTLEYQCRFELIVDVFMMDAWILGDSVLRHTLITFDLENKKINYLQDLNRLSEENVLGNNEAVGRRGSDYFMYILIIIMVISICFLIFKWALDRAARIHHESGQYSNINNPSPIQNPRPIPADGETTIIVPENSNNENLLNK